MSVDNVAAKEIKSVLIDYPFDVPTFATVQLKERWARLLTKVDVKEKFNNKTVMANDIEESLSIIHTLSTKFIKSSLISSILVILLFISKIVHHF